MTLRNPLFVLFIAGLSTRLCFVLKLMTELFFISLSLPDPWDPLKKFLVQAFGEMLVLRLWHLGERDKLLLQEGGERDSLTQVSFQVVAERD